eukprot:1181225-Amphidinium_carterae.1
MQQKLTSVILGCLSELWGVPRHSMDFSESAVMLQSSVSRNCSNTGGGSRPGLSINGAALWLGATQPDFKA